MERQDRFKTLLALAAAVALLVVAGIVDVLYWRNKNSLNRIISD